MLHVLVENANRINIKNNAYIKSMEGLAPGQVMKSEIVTRRKFWEKQSVIEIRLDVK